MMELTLEMPLGMLDCCFWFAIFLSRNSSSAFYLALTSQIQFSSVQSLSRVRLFATPWTVAYQAPQSMGFSRQEFWSGLPFPSPGDLPWPRDRTPVSRIVCRCVTIWATREACISYVQIILMAPTSHSNSPYSTCQEISVKILPAAEYICSNYASQNWGNNHRMCL